MARIDQTPFQIQITSLTHDGRGVGRRPEGQSNAGKAVFVSGALPGETVLAQQTARQRGFDQARVVEVLLASADRVPPRCAHFGTCAGCALQHLDPGQQMHAKQRVLLENLDRIGHVTPQAVLPTLTDAAWGYRRKGRFSVRHVEKKAKTLVGFREQDPRFVADLSECHTVTPAIGRCIPALSMLVEGMDARCEIPQIEFNTGDPTADHDGVALVFRNLVPLGPRDAAALVAFARQHRLAVFLQPGGVESVQPLWPLRPRLSFRLPAWDIELNFEPLDFIQVNAGLNQKMIASALQLLDAQPGDRVLELFCGLGNFTLPLARSVREVVGIEGDPALVRRAGDNARHNGIGNARFHAADLARDVRADGWLGEGFDRLLLDPPRSGADAVLRQLPLNGLQRIVYVSCHAASLARDAGYLVNDRGWTLRSAGVMDMFPHTAHVESVALFEPPRG